MNSTAIRAQRINELTTDALAGKSYEYISTKAHRWASKPVAKEYIEEVQRRIKKLMEKKNNNG